MELKTILGAIAIVILLLFGIVFLFFGVIFALASVYAATRLVVAALLFVPAFVLFVAAFGIGYYITKKPKTIIQKVEFSGEMKAVAIKCPHCSGSIDSNRITIKDGVPFATCPYCGHTFEVSEEPKW